MANIFEQLPQPLPFETLIKEIENSVAAFNTLIDRAHAGLRDMLASPQTSCEEALALFDKVTRDLTAIVSVVSHLESVCSTPELRAANEKIQELSAEFTASLYSDPELYRFLAARKPSSSDERSHRNLLFAFESSGAKLTPAEREKFISIEQELAELTTRFSQAVLDSTKEWEYFFETETDLPGLLESDLQAAKEAAAAVGKSGYRFTLHAPSFRAISSFHKDRSIREKFSRAYSRRASDAPYDNSARVSSVLKLRAEKARLLGYPSFADLMTADRMAKSSNAVRDFFSSITASILESSQRDLIKLTDFAHRNGHPAEEKLEGWDIAYYLQRYEEQELGLDPEVVREYFPFEPTLERIFELLEEVFGVSFERSNLPVWWPGVQSFSARGFGKDFGALYTDYYARGNKRAGAWMDMLAPSISKVQRGIGFMAGNFSMPTADRPALLTHDEITTLFHEAGHLLHGLVCETARAADGMQNVAWDFIEVPSQLMENWAWEPRVLKRITRHYKTGEPMPEDLIKRLIASRYVMNGIFYARHLGNSALDLELHTSYSESRDGDPITWSRDFIKRYVPYAIDNGALLNSFTHLFDGPEAYAGGYYSYLWSEALEADIFTLFAGDRILDRKLGEKYVREILMPGDTVDASEMVRRFLGREPSQGALLKRVNAS